MWKLLEIQIKLLEMKKCAGWIYRTLDSQPVPRTSPGDTQTQFCLGLCGVSGTCDWEGPVSGRGPPQGLGLWVQRTWVWHKPSWRRSPLTPPQSCQNLYRTGETDPWRAQTETCEHQDAGERSSDPKRGWPRLARECPGVSGGGVGRWWPAAGWGHWV